MAQGSSCVAGRRANIAGFAGISIAADESAGISRFSFLAVHHSGLHGRRTPGLFVEAGYTDAEVDELMPTIDRVVDEEWAARNAR